MEKKDDRKVITGKYFPIIIITNTINNIGNYKVEHMSGQMGLGQQPIGCWFEPRFSH